MTKLKILYVLDKILKFTAFPYPLDGSTMNFTYISSYLFR